MWKLIRDRLVCGVHSDILRKSLLRHPELTLTKAIKACQIYEQTEQHTKDLATLQTTTATVNAVHQAFVGKNRHSKLKHKLDSKALQIIKNCNNCGSDHPAKRDKCPAFGQQCNGCKKWNHFKKCCRSTQANQAKHCYIKTVFILKLSTMLNGGSELHTLATFTLPCCLSSQTYDLLF